VSAFPATRLRRLRRTDTLRALVRETSLSLDDVVMPLFACPGEGVVRPVAGLPGIAQRSVDEIVREAAALAGVGVRAVLLFGIPETKDTEGSGAWDEDGIVQRALRALRAEVPGLTLLTDVCLCEYTDHGHCGLLRQDASGAVDVDNDATLEVLARAAVVHAKAGADVVAPSDMMDGRVAAIRSALDAESLTGTAILSYAVKYASGFYGPFREAADCAPKFGDRAGYQMDPGNAREGLREAALDEEEGADMLMVKPALAYLDVIARVREVTTLPLGAYNVSGEYAMIKAAAERGMIDEKRAVLELLTSIRRAGADFILTYHALDAARWLG
jgi:porphobilinogen synthase